MAELETWPVEVFDGNGSNDGEFVPCKHLVPIGTSFAAFWDALTVLCDDGEVGNATLSVDLFRAIGVY